MRKHCGITQGRKRMDKRLHVVFFKMLMKEEYAQGSREYIMESFVEPILQEHPNWVFEDLYIDWRRYCMKYHTEIFADMRRRCEQGGIDLIYTESVRRFDCNMERTFGSIRMFADMQPPIGILFEKELIYSLSTNGKKSLELLEESCKLEKTLKLRKNRMKPNHLVKYPCFVKGERFLTESDPSLST